MSKAHEDELNSLVASSLSEAHTPLQGGSSLISELASSNVANTTNLSSVFKASDNVDPAPKVNAGELLGNITKRIIEEDNRLHTIKIAYQLCNSDLSIVCRQKQAGGKNTFCTELDCCVDYRNENSPPIQLLLKSAIIMRSNNAALISLMSSIENIDESVLIK